MRTSNPALNPGAFEQARSFGMGETMTMQGAVNKTLVLLALILLSASYVWGQVMQSVAPMFEGSQGSVSTAVGPLMMLGVIGGGIVAFITVFKQKWAPILAPVYALLEGLALGGISAIFEVQYPGLVVQAVLLTFGTLFSLLMAYKSGMIQVTNKFRMGLVAATGAICLLYVVDIILGLFKMSIPFISAPSPFGIGFSVVVVIIAALNLVLDFDFIEQSSRMGAPRYMEWYSAFGLIVTLVWLYLEILRLLAKFRDRR